MWDSRVMVGLLTAVCAFSCASAPPEHTVVMNNFIADDKLASVEICRTTAQDLVKSFGNPSGQGRDGDMGVLNWNAMAMTTSPGQAAMGTQMVMAWVDREGLVAGFVVNTVGIPQKPAPCREQRPSKPAEDKPAPPEVRHKPTDA